MDDDDVWFRSPEPLGWPLALLAFCVGVFATDFATSLRYFSYTICVDELRDIVPMIESDWDTRVLLGVLYAGVFAIAGRWVARRITEGAPPKRTLTFAVFAAGQASACVVGMVTLGQGFQPGMVLGGVVSVMCLPFALLMVHNAGWAWRARLGSVLHRAYRRARWIDVATGVTILLAGYANPVFGAQYVTRGMLATVFVFAASSLAVIMLVLAVSSLVRVGRLGVEFATARAGGEVAREGGARIVDLGIGEERKHDVAAAASAYRHQEQVRAVCVGDMRRAWRVIGLAAGRALTVAAIGAAVLATSLRLDAMYIEPLCR